MRCVSWQPPRDRKRISAHAGQQMSTLEQRLQAVQLPPWLLGGRFRFRKDRWAYAPRQFYRDRAAARSAWMAAEEEEAQYAEVDAEDADTAAAEKERLRRQTEDARTEYKYRVDPFVNVTVLMLSLQGQQPPVAHDDATPWALHVRCHPATAYHRALCIRPDHLMWGSAADNAWHHSFQKGGLPVPAGQEWAPPGFGNTEEGRAARKLAARLRRWQR